MKSSFLFFLFFTLLFGQIISQGSYSLTSSKTINLNVTLNQNTASKIYLSNTGNSNLVLKWKKIEVSLPNDWVYSTCDAGACYGGVPIGPIAMDTILAGGQAYIGIDVEPITTIGTGIIMLYIYQEAQPLQGDTLTWYITSEAVNINEFSENEAINVFPNPSTEYLKILTNEEIVNEISIMDSNGEKVKVIKLNNLNSSLVISDLNSGSYTLVVETKKGVLKKRFIKTN